MANSAVAEQFGGMRLAPGQMSIPTKVSEIENEERDFNNAERPVFIHKGQKSVSNNPINGKKLGNVAQNAATGNTFILKFRCKICKEKIRCIKSR
jgi:hypothetical protein